MRVLEKGVKEESKEGYRQGCLVREEKKTMKREFNRTKWRRWWTAGGGSEGEKLSIERGSHVTMDLSSPLGSFLFFFFFFFFPVVLSFWRSFSLVILMSNSSTLNVVIEKEKQRGKKGHSLSALFFSLGRSDKNTYIATKKRRPSYHKTERSFSCFLFLLCVQNRVKA